MATKKNQIDVRAVVAFYALCAVMFALSLQAYVMGHPAKTADGIECSKIYMVDGVPVCETTRFIADPVENLLADGGYSNGWIYLNSFRLQVQKDFALHHELCHAGGQRNEFACWIAALKYGWF
jgi:hypothetical protein